MAAVVAILKALRLLIKRELGTFFAVRFNNLFLFAALLAYTSLASRMMPITAIPFFSLLLLIMLFPLSSDPLSKIPPSRTALWPLTSGQWTVLRLASLGLSPLLWLALLVLLATRRFMLAGLFLLVAAAAQVLATLGTRLARRVPQFHPQRHLPQVPGRLGGLIRHNIRQILSILDFYAALLFSVGAIAYRFFKEHPDSAAYPPLAMMVALALSTYTQCSFGLDSVSGMTRYRLLPLRGWEILLAKDIAFLSVLFILTLPTGSGMIAGMTFGLTVIALGRHPSLALRLPLRRWRFASGDLRFSGLQFMAAPTLGFAASRSSLWFLGLALFFYLVSLLAGGWYFERSSTQQVSS
ncbi:MAG TPA: hypothetical protein VKY85_22470 [Candidatus Angelobacter sp.]|nr:hypothetical protein [Candidatus Angelobacter sp.]